MTLLAPIEARANRKHDFDKRACKREYRGALDRLARGEAERAVADLVELDSRIGAATESNLGPLWKAKLSVIRDLLKTGPEILVPVSQLHEQAYLAHLEHGSYALASHSRTLTIELAELYVERVKGTHGERVASAVMTSMAGHLHANYVDPTASALYRRAIALDPTNTAAMLGLASIFERHGEYDKALPVLRSLAETAPRDPEGRLRLATHLIRLDEPAEAERVLRGLVEEQLREPRWIYSLAYQELARVLIERGEFDEAAALLDGAIRSLPGDSTLPILLAYVSDRARRPSSKAELASGLRGGVSSDAESPRYRYSRMPHRALDQLRAVLRGESAAQLPTLAEALSDGRMLASTGSR